MVYIFILYWICSGLYFIDWLLGQAIRPSFLEVLMIFWAGFAFGGIGSPLIIIIKLLFHDKN